MNAISYKQLRAFAAQYGAVVGLMWIVSFAFYIIGLTRPATWGSSSDCCPW